MFSDIFKKNIQSFDVWQLKHAACWNVLFISSSCSIYLAFLDFLNFHGELGIKKYPFLIKIVVKSSCVIANTFTKQM